MKKLAKISIPAIAALLLAVCGCGNEETASPYGDLLQNPPYAGVSDSIRKDPGNDLLYFHRAILLNRNGIPEPALADFRQAWQLNKKEDYALGTGSLLLDKNPDSAVAFLRTAIAALPQSTLLPLTLAHAYANLGRANEALQLANELLARNPQQVDVLKMKADLLAGKDSIPEAIAVLEDAYRLTPYDVELNYQLALQYAQTKNPKVLLLCDSLSRQEGAARHAEPSYYRGIYYANTGSAAKAMQQFEDAIRRDYTFLDAYIEKASLLYDQKKYQEAYNTAVLAVNVSAKYADGYYWMAKCEEAEGQKADALLNYQRAYGLDKTMGEAKAAIDRLQAK